MICSDYFVHLENVDTQEKFTLIYEKYIRLMHKVANDVVNDKYLAEDIVHETFLKLCNDFSLVDEVDSKKTMNLLVIMTRNTAIDFYRKRNKNMENEVYLEDLENHQDIASPDEYFSKKDEYAEFKNLIMNLAEKDKEILLLKYVNEYKNSEIAGIMGISEVNVRKKIERAKKALKNLIKEKGELK